jgi:3-oxoacyl-(acyl-carrier-protein) synthase
MLLASDHAKQGKGIRLAVASESEGVSVTRPSMDGSSLSRAIEKLPGKKDFDLIIAHGTGTKFNDFAEDQAFRKFPKAPVTGCKWSVGHTLGASGAVDIAAASLVLERQKIFSLANTLEIDAELRSNYLVGKNQRPPNRLQNILVSSLGFGGIHAAVSITEAAQ